MNYKRILNSDTIQQLMDDGSIRYIPNASDNADWRDYLTWAQTHTPLDADPPPPPDPQTVADNATFDTLKTQYAAIKNGITTISAHCDTILAGPVNPTASQTGTALKLLAGDLKQTVDGINKILDVLAIYVKRERG